MGSPKALLDYEGETFLDRLIASFRPCCQPVVVVLGHQAEAIRKGAQRAQDAVLVVNPHPELGQLSSLQCGLRAVPPDSDGVIFTPVDHPLVLASTLQSLAEAFERQSDRYLLFIPRHEGRRGHPVAVARGLIPEFLALPPESQAREVIYRNAGRTCYVDVSDPGILVDVDDQETYRRLLEMDGQP